MISGVQTDHLMICYCIYEGHLTRFPCFNGPRQYYQTRWITAIHRGHILCLFSDRKTSNIETLYYHREKGIHGSTFQNLTFRGQIFWGTWWSECQENWQTTLFGLIQRQIKRSFPIEETLRKILHPLLIKRPFLRIGCGKVPLPSSSSEESVFSHKKP